MVIFGGVGEAAILKWLGGKALSILASHLAVAPASAVQHFAMHGAIATISGVQTATAAGGAAAGAHAIYSSGKAYNKLRKEVDKQSKEGGPSQTEIARHIYNVAEAAYALKEHKSKAGKIKTSFLESEICVQRGCSCLDYDEDDKSKVYMCTCGHGRGQHNDQVNASAENVELIVKAYCLDVAEAAYKLERHMDIGGEYKVGLGEIDTWIHIRRG